MIHTLLLSVQLSLTLAQTVQGTQALPGQQPGMVQTGLPQGQQAIAQNPVLQQAMMPQQGLQNGLAGAGMMPNGIGMQQPGVISGAGIPGAVPQQPGMLPQQPGMIPQQPGMIPQQPGMIPQQPGMLPQQPGIPNPQPGMSQANVPLDLLQVSNMFICTSTQNPTTFQQCVNNILVNSTANNQQIPGCQNLPQIPQQQLPGQLPGQQMPGQQVPGQQQQVPGQPQQVPGQLQPQQITQLQQCSCQKINSVLGCYQQHCQNDQAMRNIQAMQQSCANINSQQTPNGSVPFPGPPNQRPNAATSLIGERDALHMACSIVLGVGLAALGL